MLEQRPGGGGGGAHVSGRRAGQLLRPQVRICICDRQEPPLRALPLRGRVARRRAPFGRPPVALPLPVVSSSIPRAGDFACAPAGCPAAAFARKCISSFLPRRREFHVVIMILESGASDTNALRGNSIPEVASRRGGRPVPFGSHVPSSPPAQVTSRARLPFARPLPSPSRAGSSPLYLRAGASPRRGHGLRVRRFRPQCPPGYCYP